MCLLVAQGNARAPQPQMQNKKQARPPLKTEHEVNRKLVISLLMVAFTATGDHFTRFLMVATITDCKEMGYVIT